MSLWSKIIGTIENAFSIGVGGPQWANDSSQIGGIDAKTPDGTTYVNVRAADPVIDDDLATKRYTDERIDALERVLYRLIETMNANGIDLPLDILHAIEERIGS